MRRVAWFGAGLLALLLAAAACWFGPEMARPRVEAVASRAVGRAVTVGGLHLLPAWPPTLEATGIAVANPPGASRSDLATINRVTAELDPGSTASGGLRLRMLRVTGLDLRIEVDAQGRSNLPVRVKSAPVAPSPAASPGNEPAPVASASPLERVARGRLEGSRIEVRDARSGWVVGATVAGTIDRGAYDLGLSGELPVLSELHGQAVGKFSARVRSDQPVTLLVQTTLRGEAVQVAAQSGTADQLRFADRVPLTLDVQTAGASGHLAGTLFDPRAPSSLEADLSIRAPDTRRLAVLLGSALKLDGPLALDAHGAVDRSRVDLRALSLTGPQGDLEGAAQLSFGQRQALRATLASRRLDLDPLLAALAPAPVAPAPAQATTAPPPPAATLISDRPLPWASLDRLDADVTMTAGALTFGGAEYRDLAGHAVAQNGKLDLQPFTARLPGGSALDFAAHLEARATPPSAALVLHAPAVSVAKLLTGLALPAVVDGAATVAAELHGAGVSLHGIASTLDGQASLRLSNGSIDGAAVAGLFGAARLPAPGNLGRVPLKCLDVGLSARNGVAGLSPLVAEADRLSLTGEGSVDLARETLDLRLRPVLRSGSGLSVPLRVSGPLRHPKVAPDAAAGVGLLAGLAGQPGGGSELCAVGAAPSPAQTPVEAVPVPASRKPPKPIDVLRSLLR